MNTFALLLFLYWVFYLGINGARMGKDQRVLPAHLLLSQVFSWSMLIFGGFFALGWYWQQFLMVAHSVLPWGVYVGTGFDSLKAKYNPFVYLIIGCLVWWVYSSAGFAPWKPIPQAPPVAVERA